MGCYHTTSLPDGVNAAGRKKYKTEAECLQACQEGACCEGTTCSVKPQCQCQGTGKTFKGVGTTCEPNPCLPCQCPANSQPAFPVSMTFSCQVENAVARSSQPCAASYSSDFINLVNSFSVTATVSCVNGGCSAEAALEASGQLSGSGLFDPPCAAGRYVVLTNDTKNDEYRFAASLNCNGQLAIDLGSFSFEIYRSATKAEYEMLCPSLGQLAFQKFGIYIPLSGGVNGTGGLRVLSAVPPCEGQSSVVSTNLLLGEGYLGARYTQNCNVYSPSYFQGAYPESGGASFDIAARISCTLNYANPLP